MNIHVDTLFALGGRIYRPGRADAPDDVAKWAIGRGYARPASAAPESAPENKAHAAAPRKSGPRTVSTARIAAAERKE